MANFHKVIIIKSAVEMVGDFLVAQGKGTLGTDLFLYEWGNSINDSILVTSTDGEASNKLLDQTTNRLVTTFVNILIRAFELEDALETAKDLINMFEKNTSSYFVSNEPRRDEPIYVGKDSTPNGNIYLFGIDLRVISVQNNL